MSRIATLPRNTAAGVVLIDVATADASGQAVVPEWIKIAPRGAATTRDGRAYSFDPEGLVARFVSDKTDLPLDFEHATVRRAAQGEKVDAIGWATELAARPDGLYARVNLLPPARAALQQRTHRYVSPAFHHTDAGAATWLHSISLVSAPALSGMPALADTNTEHRMSLKALAAALGLAETADEPACLAAIAALKAGPAKEVAKALGLPETADGAACLSAIGALKGSTDVVPRAVHEQALATLSSTTSRVEALETGIRAGKVNDLIEGALKARKITPAQRDSYVALCATDAGLAQVTALLAATPAALSPSGLDALAPSTGDNVVDPVKLAAEAGAYVAEQAALGATVRISDAVVIMQSRRK